MLKQVQLKNIKSLADVTIDLAPFTVLVGPNGCGKSTVLDQVDRLCVASRPMPVRQYSIGNLHYFLEDVEEERRSAAGMGRCSGEPRPRTRRCRGANPWGLPLLLARGDAGASR
ncbi:MAG: AAA family ATPase [Deltaproteobacteria bacterium]|nr:AAA family ATPase [Deltaproteobacteria bacterium]